MQSLTLAVEASVNDSEQVKALLSSSHETVKQLSVCSEATSLKMDDLAIRVESLFSAQGRKISALEQETVLLNYKTRGKGRGNWGRQTWSAPRQPSGCGRNEEEVMETMGGKRQRQDDDVGAQNEGKSSEEGTTGQDMSRSGIEMEEREEASEEQRHEQNYRSESRAEVVEAEPSQELKIDQEQGEGNDRSGAGANESEDIGEQKQPEKAGMTEEQKVAIEEADSPGGAIEPVGAEKGSDQGNSYDFFEMEGEEEAMNDMGAEAEGIPCKYFFFLFFFVID